MRKIFYLLCFAILCAMIIWGSGSVLQPDTTIRKAPLPTAQNLPTYKANPQDVLVPLANTPKKGGTAYVGQASPVTATSAYATQGLALQSQSTVQSYGASATAAGGTSTYGGARRTTTDGVSNGGYTSSTIPSVNIRNNKRNQQVITAYNQQQENGAATMNGNPQAVAAQAQERQRGMVLSTKTSLDEMELGYTAAAQYMRVSPHRAPPGYNQGDSDEWYGTWLDQGYAGDEDMEGIFHDKNEEGQILVDQNALYALFLQKQKNGDLPGNGSWTAFLQWFNGQSTYAWMPITDGTPLLLLLLGGYVIYIARKQRKQAKQIV